MKILLCIPFPRGEPKGNSVAACRLAAGLTARGAHVELLDAPGVQNRDHAADAVRFCRPDVVLTLHAWRCATAFVAIRQAAPQVPQVVSMRGTDLNEMLADPVTGPEIAPILSAAAAITVFHQAAVDRLRARQADWGAKSFVIPNGVTLAVSDIDFRARLGIPRNALVFGSVAGLRDVKRPLLALPWLASLRNDVPALAWMHAGAPIEEAVVRQLQEFTRAHPWVYHVDEIPHEEIDSFHRAADVVVAASRSEGMPHAVREAMLTRRALLLSDIEGHRNMATPEQEALFFSDEAGFCAQARRLANDAALRQALGERACARVENEMRSNDEIGAYLKLFETILKKGVDHG